MIFPLGSCHKYPIKLYTVGRVRCRYLLPGVISSRMVRSVVLLLILVAIVSASYSRFGSNKANKPEGVHPSINDQMMHGSPIRYYGRFRDGSDDVLNRYFNRL